MPDFWLGTCRCGRTRRLDATEMASRRLQLSLGPPGDEEAAACQCGATFRLFRIVGVPNGEACDDTCLSAKGRVCGCVCGGRSHGGRWAS